MDAILFAILFTIPGLMVRNIEKRLFTKTKEEDSDYIKQYNFFIDSTFIYFIGLIIYEIMYKTPIFNLASKIELNGIFLNGNKLKTFILYFIWSLIICYPYAKIKKYLFDKPLLDILNKHKRKKGRPIETKFSSVWDELFENPDEPITNNHILVIEKEGNIITQGYIKSYSPPHLSRREFLLEGTDEVKLVMEEDKNRNEEEKLLNVVKMEYYDTLLGINIKFLDTTKLENHLRQNDIN